jgi:hypothetical protein
MNRGERRRGVEGMKGIKETKNGGKGRRYERNNFLLCFNWISTLVVI